MKWVSVYILILVIWFECTLSNIKFEERVCNLDIKEDNGKYLIFYCSADVPVEFCEIYSNKNQKCSLHHGKISCHDNNFQSRVTFPTQDDNGCKIVVRNASRAGN